MAEITAPLLCNVELQVGCSGVDALLHGMSAKAHRVVRASRDASEVGTYIMKLCSNV